MRVAPTTHSGQVLGLIVAVRPRRRDQFTTDDDTMLTELARQVGLALHNVELDSALQESLDEVRRQADELQASRARIVAASDAARRQIERNLHDGAQQHLVALAVNVRLARQLAETDPEASLEILDQLGERPPGRGPGAAGPGPRHLPAAADRPGHRRGAALGGRPRRAADRGRGDRSRAATRPSSRRPSTSAAWRRSRTRASTPATAPRVTVRVWEETGRASASRCPTPGPASTPTGSRARGPAS